jgi:hypothetical protein
MKHWLAVMVSMGMVMTVLMAPSRAEEKNGLSVSITKKTLDRADTRMNSYYSDRIDRTQGLKVTVKNVSFKPMPEGEIEWTLLVRKYYSTSVDKYTGKEPLKALKPAETADLTIGAAQIHGWNYGNDQVKDKIEHQIIVTQAGKEVFRTASTSGFEAVAKRATLIKPEK